MSETLLQAVRALRVADPDLGQKPLLAKLREQQPDMGAGAKEVREALAALKAENEAAKAAASASAAAASAASRPAANEGGAPPNVALSLACIGCFRLPSDMDDGREKHPSAACAAMRSCRRRTSAATTALRTLALGSCTECSTRG